VISEKDMQEWVGAFKGELSKIETFYKKKLEEYRNEFEKLKQKYL